MEFGVKCIGLWEVKVEHVILRGWMSEWERTRRRIIKETRASSLVMLNVTNFNSDV